jgi:F0F1-type ATP synthase membrane subunit b/b'
MEEHATSGLSALIPPAINLAILIGFLVIKVKQPLKEHVRARHATLRDELRTVRDKLASSQERYDEFTRKLKAMDAEVSALREQAKQDAKAAQGRIATESKKLSANVVADAKAAAANLYTDLKGQLLAELGNRVLERAEAILKEKLTGADRIRIRQEFSAQVERAQ